MRSFPLAAPVAMLVAAMACIQLGASIAKQLFPLVGPQGTTTLRLLFAAALLCAIWRPWRQRLTSSDKRSVLIYGLSIGGMTLLISQAIARIPLAIAVTLEFTGPIAVALLASRRWQDFLWIALAAAGVLLLLPISEWSAPIDSTGVVFALGAGVCWFLYIVSGKKSAGSIHPGTAVALGMTVAALTALPFGIAQAGAKLVSMDVVPFGIAVAILSSVIPYSLEMLSLRSLPAKNFGILMSLEPVFAALFGFLVLREHLAWIQCLAIASIVAASVGSTVNSAGEVAAEDSRTI